MTIRSLLLALVGGFSFMLPVLQADIVPGSQSNVTLTLTASFTTENAPKVVGGNTTFSGVSGKTSFGNAQLIAAMNEAGDLPDDTVTGWKLVMVNSAPESGDGARSFYLVKTGQVPVPVPYLSFVPNLPGITEAYSESVATANVSGGDYAPTDIIVGKTTVFRKQMGIVGSVPADGAAFTMVGVMALTDKSGLVKISTQTFKYLYQVVTAKISGIVGSADDSDDPDGDDLLVEGSITFTAETPLDISAYPPQM